MANTKQHKRPAKDGRLLQQVAALPYRVSPEGQLQILVVTSRETRRAVIPKGWPMKNHKDWKSAQIEAWQEAGIVGEVSRKKLGQYRYWKRLESNFALVKVSVYPLAVHRQMEDFPERGDRLHVWMAPEDAALIIDETDLGALISAFAQSGEWRKNVASSTIRAAAFPELNPA
ncbi:NUDIX hydrolase [Ancylobacter radicis]|uniref:NUDIX hydrolase n=1 Tax=Ancylobacter radicis TaxID=2836179 RepID=A0ABS5RDJ0_9HYPH|nr:NUDIX hydrolase [Ancylobacter radicis]MBS9478422.1 NUDIX hydrolase [Ancylobacter radicis]